jgi:hemerythrin superfamily protein
MDVYELLKTDHKTVSELFKKFEQTTTRASKTREDLFTKIQQELELHAALEEEMLYPLLEEAEETHEIALEAVQEHDVVKKLLAELADMDLGDEEFDAKLTVLKENVEHHVEEEEGEMFPKARKVIDKDQAKALGERMQAAKKKRAAAVSQSR